ncbi:hypothetical protein KUH03_42560 [Sphingobacterium sp. E70]|nr:hypothetical protein [Sphingobacterium sp. E70]ULT25390.1 hypothetical protein KUH03_42560 [Sphingobacterium sp. E70]
MLGNIDLGIAVAYIALILIVGIRAGIGSKRNTGTAEGYFLAGKSLRWPAIGLALFATNISTVHLVSLAQSGFDTGLLNGNFEWMAAFTLVLLALFLYRSTSSPVWQRSRISWKEGMTVPVEIG